MPSWWVQHTQPQEQKDTETIQVDTAELKVEKIATFKQQKQRINRDSQDPESVQDTIKKAKPPIFTAIF